MEDEPKFYNRPFFTGADSSSQLFPFTVDFFLQALTVTVHFFLFTVDLFLHALTGSSSTLCTMYHNTNDLEVGN